MNKYVGLLSQNVDPIRVAMEAQTDIAYLEHGINSLVIPAFRYALGRGDTYLDNVCGTIRANMDIIDTHLLEIISKETKEFILKSPLDGIAEWEILANAIDKYLETLEQTKEINE